MNNSEQQRRVVVITGASAGVGRATAHAFAKEGAHIGLIARGAERLEAARREVEELGGKAVIVAADVADADAIEAAAATIEQQLGPIDVWVNNAMTSVFSPVKEMTADEFKRVTEVTYLGFVNGTLAALKRMLPRDRRHHSGRQRAGVSRHSSAGRVLRREARHPRLLRLAAL